MAKHIVVLTGAGISQESGIKTFRDSNGLWENHDIMEVASPEGFVKNPELVLDFYNQRRKQLKEVQPNAAHYFLAALEKNYRVSIITQNVDDLHERAGSSKVIHLHGELKKSRSIKNEYQTFPIEDDIKWGDLAADGGQLRPHIVWFGEAVPEMENAIDITKQADIFVVIGTSMQVYPAASLVDFLKPTAKLFVIDPSDIQLYSQVNFTHIKKKATQGVEELRALLIKD